MREQRPHPSPPQTGREPDRRGQLIASQRIGQSRIVVHETTVPSPSWGARPVGSRRWAREGFLSTPELGESEMVA